MMFCHFEEILKVEIKTKIKSLGDGPSNMWGNGVSVLL